MKPEIWCEAYSTTPITLSIDDDPQEVRGKYFRIVGRLIADGQDISDLLIQQQWAVLYDGGTKTEGDPGMIDCSRPFWYLLPSQKGPLKHLPEIFYACPSGWF